MVSFGMWAALRVPGSANTDILRLAEVGEDNKRFAHRAQKQLYHGCIVFEELLFDPHSCVTGGGLSFDGSRCVAEDMFGRCFVERYPRDRLWQCSTV